MTQASVHTGVSGVHGAVVVSRVDRDNIRGPESVQYRISVITRMEEIVR